MSKPDDVFEADEFTKLFQSKALQKDERARTALRPGVSAPGQTDGRIVDPNEASGRVQLNVRVAAEVKVLVLRERARRKAGSIPGAQVEDIVAEALLAFLGDKKVKT